MTVPVVLGIARTQLKTATSAISQRNTIMRYMDNSEKTTTSLDIIPAASEWIAIDDDAWY